MFVVYKNIVCALKCSSLKAKIGLVGLTPGNVFLANFYWQTIDFLCIGYF